MLRPVVNVISLLIILFTGCQDNEGVIEELTLRDSTVVKIPEDNENKEENPVLSSFTFMDLYPDLSLIKDDFGAIHKYVETHFGSSLSLKTFLFEDAPIVEFWRQEELCARKKVNSSEELMELPLPNEPIRVKIQQKLNGDNQVGIRISSCLDSLIKEPDGNHSLKIRHTGSMLFIPSVQQVKGVEYQVESILLKYYDPYNGKRLFKGFLSLEDAGNGIIKQSFIHFPPFDKPPLVFLFFNLKDTNGEARQIIKMYRTLNHLRAYLFCIKEDKCNGIDVDLAEI